MKIGIVKEQNEPVSFHRYRENVINFLGKSHELVIVSSYKEVHNCDVLWHPGLGGARRVPNMLKRYNKPLVVTMHGTVPFSTPLKCLKKTRKEMLETWFRKEKIKHDWRCFGQVVSAVISVSEYSKSQLIKHLCIPSDRINVVFHGVDRKVFCYKNTPRLANEYILHVSTGGLRKNTKALIDAYSLLPLDSRPNLLIVGHKVDANIPGVINMPHNVSHKELADYYTNALVMVMPSLEESFGMPIIEAMACGCPVITSQCSGCAEVAGEAALLIDPYSTQSIYKALATLIWNDSMLEFYSKKGLRRSEDFNWSVSANEHEDIFKRVVGNGL